MPYETLLHAICSPFRSPDPPNNAVSGRHYYSKFPHGETEALGGEGIPRVGWGPEPSAKPGHSPKWQPGHPTRALCL